MSITKVWPVTPDQGAYTSGAVTVEQLLSEGKVNVSGRVSECRRAYGHHGESQACESERHQQFLVWDQHYDCWRADAERIADSAWTLGMSARMRSE